MTASLIMAIVGLACAAGAVVLFARPVRSEASVYRNRISATMLAAGAIILLAFAYALHSWDQAPV